MSRGFPGIKSRLCQRGPRFRVCSLTYRAPHGGLLLFPVPVQQLPCSPGALPSAISSACKTSPPVARSPRLWRPGRSHPSAQNGAFSAPLAIPYPSLAVMTPVTYSYRIYVFAFISHSPRWQCKYREWSLSVLGHNWHLKPAQPAVWHAAP